VVNVAADAPHVRSLRRLERGEPAVAVTLLLAAVGLVMTAYLFFGSR